VVVTIREVAKESGFSSTTVSIVLNNAPLARYIPDTTKKRIERAAKKLGYRPNVLRVHYGTSAATPSGSWSLT